MNRATVPVWAATALLLLGTGAGGVDDVFELDEMDVKAAGLQPTWTDTAGGSVAWSLDGAPGVLLNSQGGRSAQTDLSIRGSSFSGAGLSLGGLALRSPQTEHFHAELPVPAALFGKPGILTGLDQLRLSTGHLVGSVDLRFLPPAERGYVCIGAGDRDWSWLDCLHVQPFSGTDEWFGGVGVFGGAESVDSLDWSDNNMVRRGGGAHVQLLGKRQRLDLLAAAQRKLFGARGYYGVNPDWYADEQIDDFLVYAGYRIDHDGGGYVRATALWRELSDRYRLFWSLPEIYENAHDTRMLQVAVDGQQPVGGRWTVNWRFNGESDDLQSEALGDHRRERGDLTLLPEVSFDSLRIFGGVRAYAFSGETSAWLPQVGVQWDPTAAWRAFASYTETVRQPSFTELNYESPGSLGNSGLERQESESWEAGFLFRSAREFSLQAAVFHRSSSHTVDWVKAASDSPRWVATDLGDVDANGVEIAGEWHPADPLVLGLTYTWVHKSHDVDAYAGRYVLDYPVHHVQLAGEWKVCRNSRFVFAQGLRWQEDSPIRGEADFGADAHCSLHVKVPGTIGTELAVGVVNVWNDDFETFVSQPDGERRAWVSLAYRWEDL